MPKHASTAGIKPTISHLFRMGGKEIFNLIRGDDILQKRGELLPHADQNWA
jgi:hypothetical protein